jgi:gliding motility-associated-like protein
MIMLRLRICLSLLILFFNGLGNKSYTQVDTIFWFAAPEVASSMGDLPVYFRFLTYDSPATVTISQPANVGFVPIVFTIPAQQVDSVELTPFLADIESPAGDVVANTGLKITASAPISAYYELRTPLNSEVFTLKGSKGLGINFYTPFQKFWNNGSTTPGSFSSFEIVASEDNTTVLITPRAGIIGHSANATYSVVLNTGQTYSGRDTDGLPATSLSGSIISSNKPIAVTIHEGALSNFGCLSSIGDQLTTADFAGTDFVVHKTTGSNEKIYLLATQNSTNFSITGAAVTSGLINWSETREYTLVDEVTYIKTNKPIYLLHVSGNGCKLSAAQVPNLYCAGTYESLFTRSSNDSLGIKLYTRSGFEHLFSLNGAPGLIDPLEFVPVPGTNGEFVSGQFFFSTADIPVNSYNSVTNSGDVFGMAIIAGSHGTSSSFGYVSSFQSAPFVQAGNDVTTCANVPVDLEGLVGGGSVTGIWSSNGFGSFSSSLNTLNNTYIPSALDTIVSPINIILSSTGPCPVQRDTIQLIITPSPIVNASVDQVVCENNAVVQLNGDVFGGATTGSWSSLGTGTFSPNNADLQGAYTPSALDIASGQVKLVLAATNYGTCALVTDTLVVSITTAATVDAGPTSVSVCSNNPQVALNGLVTGSTTSGKWTTAGNGVFTPNNLTLNCSYNPSVTDIQSGSVKLFLESTANGTCVSVKDSITVLFTAPPVVEAGEAIIACTNVPSVNLSGLVTGPTTTGMWSGGAGTFQNSNTQLNALYTPTAAEIASGNLFLTLTSSNNSGCNAVSDNVQIIFVAPPFANFSYNEVCLENTTVFTDFSLPGYGSINNWSWDFGNGTTSVLQSESFTYDSPGDFNVTLIVTTNVGCSDTVVRNVNVYPLPTADFDYAVNCDVNQILVDFTDLSTVDNDNITSWFYDFGGQGAVSAQNPSQLFVGAGNFVITQIVTTSNGCVDTTVQVMTITPRPDAGFFYNTSNGLNIGAIFNFVDTSFNANTYTWNFGDGNSSEEQNPTYTYFENGNYVVTLFITGDYGCLDSAQTLISINTITDEIVQLIPNAISPNGDGKNDQWELDFLNLLYPEAQVEIYNRWGQQLFFSEGLYTAWDGNFMGEPVPDGTYYYIITLNDAAETPPFKGALLVLRNRN